MNHREFFRDATTYESGPYAYQQTLAEAPELPSLVRIPTGAGKTEAAILGWLYRRFRHPAEAVRRAIPRRLVYCLPTRTLVNQTATRAETWLENLRMSEKIGLVTLMGGEPRNQWHLHPEKPAIIIGTQDMLLSRALNHGYGSSPFLWPVEYGLLNNDCLWVMDEVQLMENGLPTSTQLAGLRQKLQTFGPAHSIWMSATVSPRWLSTIDHPAIPANRVLELDKNDLESPGLARRYNANKSVSESEIAAGRGGEYARQTAAMIADRHVPGTLTLAIVNTVERAQAVYKELANPGRTALKADKILIHSRFRETERNSKQNAITADIDPNGPGLVVVATQAVEAGIDISAQTLITELAPWTSMVQRFGRCNRKGEYPEASIIWMDPQDPAPYRAESVETARRLMKDMEGKSASPAELENVRVPPENDHHRTVLRKRDVINLFDTTPDLSGNHLDISRYVRDADDREVSAFWRNIKPEGPSDDEPKPRHHEIVTVPCGRNLENYLKDRNRKAWRWDILDDCWQEVQYREIHPGTTLMLDAAQGGYSPELGWDQASRSQVELAKEPDGEHQSEDGQNSDPWSFSKKRVTLSDHCRHVEKETELLIEAIPELALDPDIRQALTTAALYHDAGKSHPSFQRMMLGLAAGETIPESSPPLAKTDRARAANERRHFRHELGSALAILQHAPDLDETARDLAAYLAAAHHGKVRLAIRSLPGKRRGSADTNPEPDLLLGYPLSQSETLPAVDLSKGQHIPETILDLSIARIGLDGQGQRSWLERTTGLLDRLGPFRLAYLEAILRSADMRTSRDETAANDAVQPVGQLPLI